VKLGPKCDWRTGKRIRNKMSEIPYSQIPQGLMENSRNFTFTQKNEES
jgi:hypothetical protein